MPFLGRTRNHPMNRSIKTPKTKADKPRIDIDAPWEAIHHRAAGIDIGSREHFVCVPAGVAEANVRRFGTFTADLEGLADWLKSSGITSVAMEATGVYWIPVFQLLERKGFEVLLVNARQTKNVA